MQDIQQLLLQSRQFLEDVATIMSDSAAHFDTVLSGAGQAMSDGVTHLQTVAETMQKSFTQVAGDINNSAQALKYSTDEFIESSAFLRSYHQDLRNAYSELRALFDESQNKLEEQVTVQMAQVSELHKAFDDAVGRIMLQLQRNSEELSQATSAFTSAGNDVVGTGLQSEQQLGTGFERIAETLSATLQQHQQVMRHVDDSVRLVADRLSSLSERLDPRLLPEGEWNAVRDSLVRCADALSNAGETPHQETSPGLNIFGHDLANHLAGIHEALQANNLLSDVTQMRTTLEAIHQAVTPSRHTIFGIPLPDRWFNGRN